MTSLFNTIRDHVIKMSVKQLNLYNFRKNTASHKSIVFTFRCGVEWRSSPMHSWRLARAWMIWHRVNWTGDIIMWSSHVTSMWTRWCGTLVLAIRGKRLISCRRSTKSTSNVTMSTCVELLSGATVHTRTTAPTVRRIIHWRIHATVWMGT